MPLTMVILAAGMGSRFGGPKQLVPVGPNGECILEYNLHDAVKAGFEQVVVVTRPELKEQVMDVIAPAGAHTSSLVIAYQRIPETRTKPWGTAEAVEVGTKDVDGPFGIANADDLYGPQSFALLAEQLTKAPTEGVLVGFPLGETVPAEGSVSRGILEIADGKVVTITETHLIHRTAEGGFDPAGLTADSLGSMNLWGLPASALGPLRTWVADGIAAGGDGEILLPDVVQSLIDGGLPVHVLRSPERWSGMTNPADVDSVKAHAAARWTEPLWG